MREGKNVIMADHYEMKVPFDWEERKKWLDLDVPFPEYQERLQRLQRTLRDNKAAGMIIYGGPSDPSNLRYISGFVNGHGGESMLFIPTDGSDLVFVTNAVRHGEPAHSRMHTHWVRDMRIVLHPHSTEKPKNIADLAAEVVKERGCATARIALCNDSKIPYYLMKQLTGHLPAAEFIPGTSYLQNLRRIKSPAEIARFREACHCTDSGINKALESLRIGMTERELYTIIAQEVYARGAHSFNASVTFGARTSLKNTFVPTDYPLKEGEIVSIDVFSFVHGYRTDTHRNAMIGKPKDDLAVRLMDTALEAGLKVMAKTGPGVPIHDLQKIMYGVIEKAGLLEYDYTTSLFAHGCGLDIVEEPYFFWGNKAKLEPGMTFYLEPCLVKHGLGTACWESLIVITENGYENLSKARDKNW